MDNLEYEIKIESNDPLVGVRIDIYLAEKLPLSRSHIQRLITEHKIAVNEQFCKANYKVQTEDRITVEKIVPQMIELVPQAIPLNIIYEDQHIIVINKPRGMVVHPAAGNYSGTLVNALLEHCSDLSGINGLIRPGIVHRLDKDTSGVMVAAKNDGAHISLAKQIKQRTATRKYIAIVHGCIAEENGKIDAPIGRHPTDRKKMAVVFNHSRQATTLFKVIQRYTCHSVVECKLLTGRTHQIRVHMAYIGHPVVGDPQYGPKKKQYPIKGQALHSQQLLLTHPVTGEEMVFTAPLPDDMKEILRNFENEGR